jgi:hypothetical protein
MTAANSARPGRPLAPDIGVIGLVPNQWTDLWQPRHQVLLRLAKYFNVVWINPPREWRAAFEKRAAPETPEPAEPGWAVYDPPWYLPKVYRPDRLGRALALARLTRAWKRIERLGATAKVLYLWRPEFRDALEWPHDLSVYHIDDEYSFDLSASAVDAADLELIRRVDQVIIHSPGLWEAKGGINPHTALVPNGVAYREFAEPRPEPADLRNIPRPRIGYAGWLKLQLDWDLIAAVATESRGWSFVLVGATKHAEELERHPGYLACRALTNVHFLGRKTPEALAPYPQHFDVCIMPYRVTPYTNCIYPLKLHEYLATGRPTVGTPIRALLDFSEVVELAATADQWRPALARALSPAANEDHLCDQRRETAKRHDWDILTARIARLIADRLRHPVGSAIEVAAP